MGSQLKGESKNVNIRYQLIFRSCGGVDLGEPPHTLVLYWMSRPLPPRQLDLPHLQKMLVSKCEGVDLDKPPHTLVLCWMSKPLSPRQLEASYLQKNVGVKMEFGKPR